MKYIMKYLLVSLSLLTVTLAASAQNDGTTYNEKGGVSTAKRVTGPNDDGTYTITLETFATGTTAPVYTSTPVDVILVLDLSSSMSADYSYKQDDGTYSTGTSRLDALKYASKKFVAEIARNDEYDDDNKKRDKVLGNRIQIITFTSSVNTRFTSFQPASANLSTINSTIDGFSTGNGTRTDSGLSTAITWVNTSRSATYWTANNLKTDNDHNTVVVMFTDGCPSTSGSTNFTASYAISAVNNAKTIKSNGATVYSVGLIKWSDLSNANQTHVRNMMDYISSNFPDGTASSTNTFTCTGTRASSDYYKDANEVDLGEIFESIAQASGGSAEEIGASTQIRDEVTSSFSIPEGATADDVTVSVWDVDEDGNGWTKNTSYDMSSIKIEIDPETNKLVVSGFDYSKDDTKDANGYTSRANAGNWVGIRYKSRTETFWAGKKIVVEFNIEANPDATGGVGTATNTSDSGVYVYSSETGEYTCVNKYEIPHTTLTVTIKITKTGLRHGESATFKIQRASPKMVDGKMQYNAIGKPIADDSTWKSWSKVILTNKGTDDASVTKTLLALDPNYVYRVLEDDWSWSYETVSGTGEIQTTSTVEINPFEFENKEKTGVAKHAEAVTINHFATEAGGNASYEEYKSSKVQSF